MRKPTFCICENKDADQLRFAVTAKLITAFVFATKIVQFLYFLNPKFQASSHLLWLYSPVCVRPGRKPERWFSQLLFECTAQTLIRLSLFPGPINNSVMQWFNYPLPHVSFWVFQIMFTELTFKTIDRGQDNFWWNESCHRNCHVTDVIM